MDKRITIEFLMSKISPMAEPAHVRDTQDRLTALSLEQVFKRNYRGQTYIVFRLKDIWPYLYGREKANIPKLSKLAASLQALFWERSALNGDLVFVKEIKEYREFGY